MGYLYLPGTAANYASAPDIAAYDIAGDIDIRVWVASTVYNTANGQDLAFHYSFGSKEGYEFRLTPAAATLTLKWYDTSAGAHSIDSAAHGLADGEGQWLRVTLDVDNGASGHDVKFYLGGNGSTPSWAQLGSTTTTAGTTDIASSTSDMLVGTNLSGGAPFQGDLYRAVIKSGIDGTAVFDADFTKLTTEQELDGTFTEDSSNAATVTLNGTGWAYHRDDSSNGYMYLPGTSGNYASSPDAAALDITGDIDIRAKVAVDDWTPAAHQPVIAKRSGGNAYQVTVTNAGGVLRLNWWEGAATKTANSTVATGFTDGTAHWIRATLDVDGGAGGVGRVTFYTSDDGTTWAQLGDPVDTGSAPTSIDSTAGLLSIGWDSGSDYLTGNVYRAQIFDGIDGTLVFDADFTALTAAAVNKGTYAPNEGGVVTLNGDDWVYVPDSGTPGVLGDAELVLDTRHINSGRQWWPDLSGNNHHAMLGSASSDTANDPLFKTTDSGTQFLYLPGTDGNFASTPDAAVLDITGDIDLRAKVAMDDWTPAAIHDIISKWSSSLGAYILRLQTDGTLRLYWSEDGSAAKYKTSTVATGFTDGTAHWVRGTLDVDNGASGNDVKFYTSDDGVTWTQLGTTVTTAGTTSIYNTIQRVEVGSANLGTGTVHGNFYRAQIYNGIAGTLVFDADFTDRAVVTEPYATFTEKSGNGATVTINRSASGVPATVVDRPMWLLDGVDDYLTIADHANLDFALTDPLTLMAIIRQPSTPTAWCDYIRKRGGGNAAGYGLGRAATTYYTFFNVADGAVNPVAYTSSAPSNLTLAAVAGVRNITSDNLTAYEDTVAGSSVSDTTTASSANALALTIGGTSGYFAGQIVAVVLWRQALTQAELFEAGKLLTYGENSPLAIVRRTGRYQERTTHIERIR